MHTHARCMAVVVSTNTCSHKPRVQRVDHIHTHVLSRYVYVWLQDVFTMGDGHPAMKGDWLWHGGALGDDGCVYGVPCNAEQVLKINPRTREVTVIGPTFEVPCITIVYCCILLSCVPGCLYQAYPSTHTILQVHVFFCFVSRLHMHPCVRRPAQPTHSPHTHTDSWYARVRRA